MTIIFHIVYLFVHKMAGFPLSTLPKYIHNPNVYFPYIGLVSKIWLIELNRLYKDC